MTGKGSTRGRTPPEAVTWEVEDRDLPLLGLSVHAGHDLRPSISELMLLEDEDRRYEEDPATELFARLAPVRGVSNRSRFEVDLNRPRDEAVYLQPEDAWGLELWSRLPSEEEIAKSLAIHDEFYARLGDEIERLLARFEHVAVLDFHSYNHRRPGQPEDPDHPDVNVGTGSLDRERWGALVDSFMANLAEAGSLDVRENVVFKGRAVARFVNQNFGGRAVCLAVEFKKTFLNERTGEIYPDRTKSLIEATASTLPGLVSNLRMAGPVRRSLPGGGRLSLDRPLPALVLYRHRPDDPGTAALVTGASSHLIAGDDMGPNELESIIDETVGPLADRFGAVLLLEIWSGDAGDSPRVRIFAEAQENEAPEVTSVIAREIEGCANLPAIPVETVLEDPAPPGLAPALSPSKRHEHGCQLVGIEIPSTYRDEQGRVFPAVLAGLSREMSHVLNRAVFEFAQIQTNYEPKDFRELGRSSVLKVGWKVDEALTVVGERLDFLLNLTPVNTAAAWREFGDGGYRIDPIFHYRPLPFDPHLIKRELFELPMEEVEDPTLTFLLREKRSELDRMITMLADRDTPRFLHGSMALYGGVDAQLLAQATKLLGSGPPSADVEWISAVDFAHRAEVELDRYRQRWGDFAAAVEVRPDVPGVMVAHGSLLVGAEARIPAHRVEALIHHEVGTHLVTGHNGAAQSLKMLAVGLPGYEQTQEGLAVLAELISGGLGIDRLRTLAGRVHTVHRMIEGRPFREVFEELHEELGFSPRAAWTLTMRVFRSGGLTKDAIYLRGLLGILGHLSSGGAIEPLFMGKMALEHIPLIEELLWRRILEPAQVQPLWLEDEFSRVRLERVRAGSELLELIA